MARKESQIWYTDIVIWNKIHHWFIPHKQTHQKAHLISWEALLIYVLFFIFLQVGLSILGYAKPGILGITGNIDQKKMIELTNQERSKKGLPSVSENEALNKAAALKAQNMIDENYWAHFAPSGKTPWDFILGSGYKFTYAGENLAKNFQESDDVVSAWMTSPTHRDNLLNPKYQDIGIAVVDGVLNGQRTTLIVQMFGTVQGITSQAQVNTGGDQIAVPTKDYLNAKELVASVQNKPPAPSLIDPYQIAKTSGIAVISFLALLLVIDFVVIYRRGVFRISSHHVAHLSILSIALAGVLTSNSGSIL